MVNKICRIRKEELQQEINEFKEVGEDEGKGGDVVKFALDEVFEVIDWQTLKS